MSIMELGALGEFLGSIGVIATLIYLAVQIRQNTHSLDEGRRLASAQAYQSRSARTEDALLAIAHSTTFTEINAKLGDAGIDALTQTEVQRLRANATASLMRADNVYYQYQQGFLDEEFYGHNFKRYIRNNAPQWATLGVDEFQFQRPSFREEVDRILSESEENEQ